MLPFSRSSHNWDKTAAPEVSHYRNLAVVKATLPHVFLDASIEWTNMFHWSKQAILGRSFGTLQGPETDTQLLRSTLQASRESPQRSSTCYLTLYDSFGYTKECWLEIIYNEGKAEASYLIFFEPAHGSTQAATTTSTAVVQGSCLPRVKHVDQGFEAVFGYNRAQVAGRSINFLCGPKTDRSSIMSVFKLLTESSEATRITLYSASCNEVEVNVMVDKLMTSSSETAIFVLHFHLEDKKREEKLWGSLIPNRMSKMFLDGLHAHVDCDCKLIQILIIIWAQIVEILFQNEQPEVCSTESLFNEMVAYTRRESNKLFLKPHFCRSFKAKRVSLSS
mmetsp:Transcript_14506/g.33336  ORF Transcript_14506/g.33336 Transcript_14506/m.33336 type:complete len:335 (-) Transcript_14506:71-1075(-)